MPKTEATETTEGGSPPVRAMDRERAKKVFERARAVAETGQYDYAIELFLQGLGYDPDDPDVHKELRKISLTRKATGGKPLARAR